MVDSLDVPKWQTTFLYLIQDFFDTLDPAGFHPRKLADRLEPLKDTAASVVEVAVI